MRILIAFLFTAQLFTAQNVDLKEIDKYITSTQKEWDIPGLSVAIVKDGEKKCLMAIISGRLVIQELQIERPLVLKTQRLLLLKKS